MERMGFTLGNQLQPGEVSSTGAYALIAASSGTALRISLIREIAELHSCDPSRQLREASLMRLGNM